MAYRRRRRTKKLIVTLILLIIAVIGGVLGYDKLNGGKSNIQDSTVVNSGEAQLHFIDVGQGDCTLITMSEGNVLIDSGTNSSEEALKSYLDGLGITEFEYAVFTHPHADHIGGADMILEEYKVEKVLIPDVTATSSTYNKMMEGIEESGADLILATPEMTFSVGDMAFTVLAPNSKGYEDDNNYSVVLKAVYGSTSFMFTGDAETASEGEILERFTLESLKCDLLKVGHHGAENATSQAFLDAVSPKYAVIQVGKGNTYDHPRAEILSRLNKAGVSYYRNDLEGTIVFVTDGVNLTKKN